MGVSCGLLNYYCSQHLPTRGVSLLANRQSISARLRRGQGQYRSSSSQCKVLAQLDVALDVVMSSGVRLRPAWMFWNVLESTERL